MNPDQPLETMHLGMTLSQLIQILRRRKLLAVSVLVFAIVIAAIVTATASRVYRAEAEVLIRTEESANLFPLSEVDTLLRSPSAESGFLSSTEFETAAEKAAGSDIVVSIDVGDITSRVEPSLIQFTAEAPDPELAATIAQAWADTYVTMRHTLDAAEVSRTLSTLEDSVDDLSAERASLLAALEPLDRLVSRTNDAGEVASLSTQRLVLLQQLEPSLDPIDQQLRLLNQEIANLRLIEDFFGSSDLSARTNRIARVPEAPISPSMPKNLVLGAMLGILAAAGAMLFVESLDEGFRSAEDVYEKTGLEPLAHVPIVDRKDSRSDLESGPFAEAFERLSSAIEFAGLVGRTKQVLVFTSAHSGEAKTSTVSSLGRTLARQGRRTIVIGADLRRPTLAAAFGESRGPGLGEVLSGLYDYRSCLVHPEDAHGLTLLPAGNVADGKSPAALLRSRAFQELILELRGSYDHILIDSPPLLPVVDALNVAEVADGIVLHVFAGRSRVRPVKQSLALIERAALAAPVIGFVLTGKRSRSESSYYDYGYTEQTPTTGNRRLWSSKPIDADLVDDKEPAPSNAEPEPVVAIFGQSEAAFTLPEVSKPLDEIEFDLDEAIPTDNQIRNGESAETGIRKWSNMKSITKMTSMKAVLTAPILAVLLLSGVAGAQTYEGTDSESGIFFVPDNPTGGDSVNLKISDLLAGSDLTINFVDANGEDVDGLQVKGAVVFPVDSAGNVDVDIQLPANLPDGAYSLDVTGTKSDGSPFQTEWSFVASAQAAADAAGDTAATDLAFTGSNSVPTVVGGVLLVLVGAGLVGIAATRRRENSMS